VGRTCSLGTTNTCPQCTTNQSHCHLARTLLAPQHCHHHCGHHHHLLRMPPAALLPLSHRTATPALGACLLFIVLSAHQLHGVWAFLEGRSCRGLRPLTLTVTPPHSLSQEHLTFHTGTHKQAHAAYEAFHGDTTSLPHGDTSHPHRDASLPLTGTPHSPHRPMLLTRSCTWIPPHSLTRTPHSLTGTSLLPWVPRLVPPILHLARLTYKLLPAARVVHVCKSWTYCTGHKQSPSCEHPPKLISQACPAFHVRTTAVMRTPKLPWAHLSPHAHTHVCKQSPAHGRHSLRPGWAPLRRQQDQK